MCNYIVLRRVLELMLVKKALLKELDDVNMFVSLCKTIKATVLGFELTWAEIVTCMLRQTDLTWIDHPYTSTVSQTLEQLP